MKKFITILLTVVLTLSVFSLAGCKNDKTTDPSKKGGRSVDSTITTNGDTGGTLNDYDISANTVNYDFLSLKFKASTKDIGKTIYNKHDVVIKLTDFDTEDFLNVKVEIENKSKKTLHFSSDGLLINNETVVYSPEYIDVNINEKENCSFIIYPEVLYSYHITTIDNINIILNLDFNDYIYDSTETNDISNESKEKDVESDNSNNNIINDLSDSFSVDTTEKVDELKQNPMSIYNSDEIDIDFNGFLINEDPNSCSMLRDCGIFTVKNKTDKFLDVNLIDFSADGKTLSGGTFIGGFKTIPPKSKTYYSFYPTSKVLETNNSAAKDGSPDDSSDDIHILDIISDYNQMGFFFTIRETNPEDYSEEKLPELTINFKK